MERQDWNWWEAKEYLHIRNGARDGKEFAMGETIVVGALAQAKSQLLEIGGGAKYLMAGSSTH
jgi:hypothetical protein